jgi:hypothetical protein
MVTAGAAFPVAESGCARRVELLVLTVQMVGVTALDVPAGAELTVVPTTTDSAAVPRSMTIADSRRPILVLSPNSAMRNARID